MGRLGAPAATASAQAHGFNEYLCTQGPDPVGLQGRLTRHAIILGATALATAIADGGHSPLLAQGKLDARYTVSLAGLPIGHGTWLVDIGEEHFSAAATGATAGVMRVFTSGQGQSAVRGTISGGRLIASTYASSIVTDQKRYDAVHMVISGGEVKEFAVDPPNLPTPDRIPVTEAHLHGVLDPMTASLLRVPGGGDTFGPQACHRKISVFDGRLRYDLQLAFKRLDRVTSRSGYQGPVVVCSVYFFPIAGHVPDRAAIRYLSELREIEASFAPIAGTRVLVPYRVSVPTPIGVGVMQATQFTSAPQPGKASVTAH